MISDKQPTNNSGPLIAIISLKSICLEPVFLMLRVPETETTAHLDSIKFLQESEMLINIIIPLIVAGMLFVGLVELTSDSDKKDNE